MGLISNNKTDPNKILPIRYSWAREHYKSGVANNWTPEEVAMQDDVEMWKSSQLSESERRLILWNLGFFSTAESLTANNIVLGIYSHITDPACRQYLLRQAYEEAIHCYIEGTEVFTNNGFKDFKDLSVDDLVGQYHEDGTLTFEKPRSYFSDDFSGKLIKFSNESNSYLKIVTPDHRCVFMDERNNNKIGISLAKDISASNKRFPVSCHLKVTDSKVFSDWDRLKIAYQADGSLVNKGQDVGSRSGFVVWSFNLKKERKKTRLRELISALQLTHEEYPLPEKHGKINYVKFRIWIPLEHHVENKDFEWFALNEISSEWIREFIKESSHWDGSKRNKLGSYCYSSTNKKCIDKIMIMAHLGGYRCGLYETETITGKDYYQVHLFDKPYVSGKTIIKSTFPYTGKVYCVGVPSGMLLVRYSGKIVISGNTDTFIYCCDTLGLNPDDVYNMYLTIPSIKEKDDFVVNLTKTIYSKHFQIETLRPKPINLNIHENNDWQAHKQRRDGQIRSFLKDLIGYYVIMEGIFFYAGFAMMLALKRQKKMIGIGEQFEFVMRDESVHLAFGVDLINTIRQEEPEVWTSELEKEVRDLIVQAVKLEQAYAHDACPHGLLGINAEQFCIYVEYITDRRFERLGMDKQYNVKNPFPWMAQSVDLMKEKNFFETRVVEYQVGGLNWD